MWQGTLGIGLAICLGACTATNNSYELRRIGSFAHSENFDVAAAEISAFDPATNKLFVVNGELNGLDVLDLSNPAQPTRIETLKVETGEVTSCDVANGVVAVVASTGDGPPGVIRFFDTETGQPIGRSISVGPTPDQVVFDEAGNRILIAHEGQPDFENGIDPEGSIGVFQLQDSVSKESVATLTEDDLVILDFNEFDSDKAELIEAGLRVLGDPAEWPTSAEITTVSQDLEPEYITLAPDGSRAWITLQENNAIAIVDLDEMRVAEVVPLGLKDHSRSGQGLDASDRDGAIRIRNWPVFGTYMPDSIASYQWNGETYLVLSNEGDPKRGEDRRAGELWAEGKIDARAFENPAELFSDENLGRLEVSAVTGDNNSDGKLEELHAIGARSFSIRDAQGKLVFDSGEMIERIVAEYSPEHFNADNDDPTYDGKSDAQGPEPEGIAVGVIDGRTLCFVGFEDVGGIMIFDITSPYVVQFHSYLNDRDFRAQHDSDAPDFDLNALGHTGPEGITFIKAAESPNGKPLLVVSYEVTGTTGIYEIVKASSRN